ncbi:PREDICTED: collagen alpha-2(I) chain-like [Nipponia nippon]|uniref:collagen alpha-2(I) chain-like n=1 Tax=Nipponia nippon TaxID=128390 RepID=UPI0005114A2A|nr:PREDICTED: collagen alpha-2(I) chain-like [Nipponia nippon]
MTVPRAVRVPPGNREASQPRSAPVPNSGANSCSINGETEARSPALPSPTSLPAEPPHGPRGPPLSRGSAAPGRHKAGSGGKGCREAARRRAQVRDPRAGLAGPPGLALPRVPPTSVPKPFGGDAWIRPCVPQ